MQIDSLGRSGKFDELREFLRSAGYTEEFLRARFHLERAEQFELDRGRRAPLPEPASAADILTALYLAGEFASLAEAERLMGRNGVGLLSGMGLLEIDPGGGRCHGTAALYPLADLHIASDRWSNPGDAPFEAPSDTVYPAFIPNTRRFPDMSRWANAAVPGSVRGHGNRRDPAARQGAREASAGDIAERCTRFAGFEGRLNGVAHFHPVTSDLYGSLGSVDRIVAHPPYVPVLHPKWIFFSGGEDGEEITLHNPARDLLAILSSAEEDPLRLEHRNVRRMRHNPVERAQTPIQVAGHRVEVGDTVQPPVESGKAGASFGDVARPSLAGALSCRQDRGDSRARAQIQETAAFAQRDMLEKQARIGDERRVDHALGASKGASPGLLQRSEAIWRSASG